ncbi:hypothetical protein Tco_0520029 [Tanacetum coccineum]
MPSHVGSYIGKGDADNYLHLFEGAIRMQKWAMLPIEKVHKDISSGAQHQADGGESTRAFVTCTDDTLKILGLHKEQCIFGFVHGLKTMSLVEFLSIDLPTTYKGLMEKTYTWIKAKEVATNGAPNDHREGFDRFSKCSSWDNNKGRKRNGGRFSPYQGSKHRLLSNLSKSPRDILATEKKKGDKDTTLVKTPILMIKRESCILKRKSMEDLAGGDGE